MNRSEFILSKIQEGSALSQANSAIAKAKKKLIAQAKKSGVIENFGQKEVRSLEDKYIDSSDYSNDMNKIRIAIEKFDDWCMNYTG